MAKLVEKVEQIVNPCKSGVRGSGIKAEGQIALWARCRPYQAAATLISSASPAAVVRLTSAWRIQKYFEVNPLPFVLSLSKGRLPFGAAPEEKRFFDKLRTNGMEV